MALGFPNLTIGQNTGTTFVLNGNVYTWDGTVWNLTSRNQSFGKLDAQTIVVGNTGTINGAQIITTATLNQFVQTNLSLSPGVDISLTTITNGLTQISDISTLDTVARRGSVTTSTIKVSNTSNAISTNSGALVVNGGVGIAQDLIVGGNIYVNGRYVLTTSSFFQTIASGPDILITATLANQFDPGYIVISDISTLQSVTARGNYTDRNINITNSTQSTSTDTGALTVVGGVGINGNLTANSVRIGASIMSSNKITINTTATTVIDSYSFNDFRSTKYLIQIESGSNKNSLEVIEILLMVDNSGNVYATEYGILTNNGELGEFSAEETNNTVKLSFTANYAPTEVTYFRTTMAF
jgi:hypothetical protein